MRIAVLGAGPGGSLAALTLARRGVQVDLWDKATFPRPKPCGDVITSQTLRTLERQGLNPGADLPLKHGQATWGTTFIAPNGKAVDVNFKPLRAGTSIPSCYTLDRASFDHWLVDQVVQHPNVSAYIGSGVKKVERGGVHKPWTLQTEVGTHQYDYLLVASGCNSALVKQVQEAANAIESSNDRDFGVGLRAYFKDNGGWRQKGMPEFYLFKRLMPGGMYLTPLANGVVNVNLVMRRDFVKRHNVNLQALFWETLEQEPALKGRFLQDTLLAPVQGSSLSFGTHKRALLGPGYALVGDAAGLIDLLSANGICNAVQSGELAAQQLVAVMPSLAPSDLWALQLHGYEQAVEQYLGKELKLGRIVAPLLGNERLLPVLMAILNFVASRVDGGGVLSQLLYHPDVSKLLRSPSFYRQLLFGKPVPKLAT